MFLISEVPAALVPVIWPIVADLFTPSIKLSDGECSLGPALDRLLSEENRLIVVTKGHEIVLAYTVKVITYETGLRELAVPLIGGTNLEDLKVSFMPMISDIARRNNCSSIVMQGARAGWARKLKPYGWEPVREILKYRVEN